MIIADLHNDTAYELYFGKKALKQNNLHIDLKKQFFSKNLLFFAIYMNPEKYGENKWQYFNNIYRYFRNQAEINSNEIEFFKSTENFLKSSKHNAVLTLEGGDMIESTNDIDRLRGLGIKAITLTWNISNKLACAVSQEKDTGLTDFGKEILQKMERENIFADLSHASDKTFFDVIKIAKKPVFVTHSNSRTLCPHKRNITDEMFEALKENGGILGINFYSEFLGEKNIYDHIEHFLKSGGENHIAFGSDFDGMDSLPPYIKDFSSYKDICELLKKKFGEKIAEKIMYKNVLKLI